MAFHEIEVWVVVDESGDYAIGSDQDEAQTAFDENVGGDSIRRAICVKLNVPLPAPLVVTGDVPEETQETQKCELKVS